MYLTNCVSWDCQVVAHNDPKYRIIRVDSTGFQLERVKHSSKSAYGTEATARFSTDNYISTPFGIEHNSGHNQGLIIVRRIGEKPTSLRDVEDQTLPR